MRLRLQELQETSYKAQKLKQQIEDYKEIDGVLHPQSLFFVAKAIRTEIISCHHDNILAGYFNIKKTCELVARKYYWLIFCDNVEAYVEGSDVCLAL